MFTIIGLSFLLTLSVILNFCAYKAYEELKAQYAELQRSLRKVRNEKLKLIEKQNKVNLLISSIGEQD